MNTRRRFQLPLLPEQFDHGHHGMRMPGYSPG